MKTLQKLSRCLAALLMGGALLAAPAMAAPTVVTETIDAGDSLGTAFDARQGTPEWAIQISGSLSLEQAMLDLVDMYWLNVQRSFVGANTGPGTDPSLIADPVIFLFDSLGVGVAMDDESGGNGQSLLGSLPLAVGDYYLAIAFAGMEPLDINGNPMFDVFGSGAVLSTDTLGSWGGSPFALNPSLPGAYDLNVAVPLPGTVALLGLGLLLAARTRRRA